MEFSLFRQAALSYHIRHPGEGRDDETRGYRAVPRNILQD